MSRKEVLEKIIQFASQAFQVDAGRIKEDTVIAEELGVASMHRVALSASIENDFDVMIPVARMGKFKTIGDLTDYVVDEM